MCGKEDVGKEDVGQRRCRANRIWTEDPDNSTLNCQLLKTMVNHMSSTVYFYSTFFAIPGLNSPLYLSL